MHQSSGATLRLITPEPNPEPPVPVAEVVPCSGEYVCECSACREIVARRVAAGVRPTPKPLKHAA